MELSSSTYCACEQSSVHMPVRILLPQRHFLIANRTEIVVVAVVDKSHRWVLQTILKFLQSQRRAHTRGLALSTRLVEIVCMTCHIVAFIKLLEPPGKWSTCMKNGGTQSALGSCT